MSREIFRPIVEQLVRVGVKRQEADQFADTLVHKSYDAKDLIFREGERLPDIVYLLSGYVKMSRTNERGDASISFFAGKHNFVGCIQATLYGQPAQYSAECITDCHAVVINHHRQANVKSNQRHHHFLHDIIVRHLMAVAKEKTALLPLKATERYLYFRERHPRFTEYLPAGLIANYLGIRPQSLSRIKQNLK